jgi:hypothetical protein
MGLVLWESVKPETAGYRQTDLYVDLEPIQLSDEILDNSGFTKAKDSWGGWLSPDFEGVSMRVMKDQGMYFYLANEHAHKLYFQSVHHLQNWYYIRSGFSKKLDIKF